jgi:hypothetical protein
MVLIQAFLYVVLKIPLRRERQQNFAQRIHRYGVFWLEIQKVMLAAILSSVQKLLPGITLQHHRVKFMTDLSRHFVMAHPIF